MQKKEQKIKEEEKKTKKMTSKKKNISWKINIYSSKVFFVGGLKLNFIFVL